MDTSVNDTRLVSAFTLVNDWLKYAELKNGALLTLNGAAVLGVNQLANWNADLLKAHPWLSWWLLGVSICFVSAMLVHLASFYAKTKTTAFELAQVPNEEESNAVFFGHLAHMTPEQIIGRLVRGAPAGQQDRYLYDLACQVIINAKIANRKLSLFNLALHISLIGALTPVLWGLYFWYFCDEKI